MSKENERKTLRIKVQKGDLAIEMEGSEDYVKQFLEDTVKTLGEAVKKEIEEPSLKVAPTIPAVAEPQIPALAIDEYEKTITGRIKYLVESGFFNEPRSLGEAVKELARIGFHYDAKTVDNALRAMLRRSGLRRLGIRGGYSYVRP